MISAFDETIAGVGADAKARAQADYERERFEREAIRGMQT
jgi:hypothetical protein